MNELIIINDEEFKMVQEVIHQLTGIELKPSKKTLVISRLGPRLKTLGFSTVKDYLSYIAHDVHGNDELNEFVNRLTTNETSFFREKEHFDILSKTLLPQLLQKGRKEIRCWSAACSTGEEPYSIAFTMLNFQKINSHPFKINILASDINSVVVKKAQQGTYPLNIAKKIPTEMLHNYTYRHNNLININDSVKNLISFKKINLYTDRYPIKNKIDIIFCRNVMIYFSDEMKKHVLSQFYKYLADDGHLVIGKSENIFSYNHMFRYINGMVYTKVVT